MNIVFNERRSKANCEFYGQKLVCFWSDNGERGGEGGRIETGKKEEIKEEDKR